jgi:hypothetical protein
MFLRLLHSLPKVVIAGDVVPIEIRGAGTFADGFDATGIANPPRIASQIDVPERRVNVSMRFQHNSSTAHVPLNAGAGLRAHIAVNIQLAVTVHVFSTCRIYL